ncbi:MAG TPA: hypothetical protein VJ873_07820 [bacterium]|nr:hypothetical protein [bacterium]
MKKFGVLFLFAILALAPWACQQPIILSPTVPSLTPTPTVNLTPVCGFTTISLGEKTGLGAPSVIRTLSDWNTFFSLPGPILYLATPTVTPVVPTPPVDFSTQMLIVYSNAIICPNSILQVNDVCEGPSQIIVSANNVWVCPVCFAASPYRNFSALAVPQSNLPIVWNVTQVPCQLIYPPTPTPTP